MKRNLFLCALYSFLLVLTACSCETEASKQADKMKADSLENQTQRAMDSANDAIMTQMNSVDDSNIVNDTDAPVRDK